MNIPGFIQAHMKQIVIKIMDSNSRKVHCPAKIFDERKDLIRLYQKTRPINFDEL